MTQLKPASDRPNILKKKHSAICNDFLALTNQFPDAAPHRIFDTIADHYGMTIPGVRNIVIKAGLYTANNR